MKKHPKRNRNSTRISQQRPSKGKIESPWNALAKTAPIKTTSWYLDSLPDYLWLVLLLEPSRRSLTFSALKPVVAYLATLKDRVHVSLTHQSLEIVDLDIFRKIVEPFKQSDRLSECLSVLGELEGLPGADRWKNEFPGASENFKDIIEKACGYAAAQDGRPATDISFINFVSEVLQGKLLIPAGVFNNDTVNRYPFDPEGAGIDGMLRSMRNASAMYSQPGEERTRSTWVNTFYDWGRQNTECAGFEIEPAEESALKEKAQIVFGILEGLRRNCFEALISDFQLYGKSEVREILSGLCLYATDISATIVSMSANSLPSGMILLRTLSEINILASHISGPSGEQEALRYRHYGAGRAKLLVNKIEELGEGASSFNFPDFSAVASERFDEMFIDMPLTSFYIPNIREVAINCGAKDIYDKYFDIGSAYAHAEWGAAATTTVQMCVNPLHLGHYVPSNRNLPVELMDDVAWLVSRLSDILITVRNASAIAQSLSEA